MNSEATAPRSRLRACILRTFAAVTALSLAIMTTPARVDALELSFARSNKVAMAGAYHRDLHRVITNGQDIVDDPLGTAHGFLALVDGEMANGDGYRRCAGVAVATDMVLTSGHCLSGVKKKGVTVSFISQLRPLEFERIKASGFKVHPKYNGGSKEPMYRTLRNEAQAMREFHDIAVVRLSEPSLNAIPITLVPPSFDVASAAADSAFFIMGRERTALNELTGKMAFARIDRPTPIVNGDGIYYQAWLRTADGFRQQGACKGDSGGPVTIAAEDEFTPGRPIHYLLGLFAFEMMALPPDDPKGALERWKTAENIPTCGSVLAYVNVQTEVEWILAAMNELDPDTPRSLQISGQ